MAKQLRNPLGRKTFISNLQPNSFVDEINKLCVHRLADVRSIATQKKYYRSRLRE
jgi:hypothetical protein